MKFSGVARQFSCAFILVLLAAKFSLPEDQNLLAEINQSLQQVLSKVSPSIVTLDVAAYVRSDDVDSPQVQSQRDRRILTKARSLGSGVIVEPNGYIITNAHVVDGATLIRVTLDERLRADHAQRKGSEPATITYDARLVGVFEEVDLALLKIDASGLPAISFANSDYVRQGQLVLAIGSPEGYRNSASIGTISAVGRDSPNNDGATFIQTDAAINPGSSGGALVDINANLIGITSLAITDRGGNAGLGFALPSNLVQRIFTELKSTGHVSYGEIGIRVQNITPALARGLHLPAEWGILVSDVVPGGAAEKVGVQVKDVVLTVDGQRMNNVSQFAVSLYGKRVGDFLELEVQRSNRLLVLKIPVTGRALDGDKFQDPQTVQMGLISKLGVVCGPLTPGAQKMRSTSGIVVVAKLAQSDADLMPGDLILSLNEVPINSVTDLRSQLDRLQLGASVVLQIERLRHLQYLPMEID